MLAVTEKTVSPEISPRMVSDIFENPLDRVAAQLRLAKEREAEATAARLVAEQEVIALMGVKEEGTFVQKGDFFKVTTVGKLNRTLDAEAFEAIKPSIPHSIRDRLVRNKPEIVLSELRYIENNEPEIYKIFSQALTVKPAKPAVSVTSINISIN